MRILLLFLLLAVSIQAGAWAGAIDLYSAEVPVGGQSAGERRQALPQALRQVLTKHSGLRDFGDYPQVESALSAAGSMLLSFYYRNVEVPLPDGTSRPETRLVAQFQPESVDQLLRSLQLPLWPPDRKRTDVWLVIDDGLERRIMPAEFAWARDAMADAASVRGLPVHWPEPDEDGTYPVDLQLLWGGYVEDLAHPDGLGVLILTALREGPQWRVRANLGYGGRYWAWRLLDSDLRFALVEAMHGAADRIAGASSIAASDIGNWTTEIAVSGLRGAEGYRRCLNYLQNLSVVKGVDVDRASGQTVWFRLRLNALPRYLDEALSGGHMLQAGEESGTWRMNEATGLER